MVLQKHWVVPFPGLNVLSGGNNVSGIVSNFELNILFFEEEMLFTKTLFCLPTLVEYCATH